MTQHLTTEILLDYIHGELSPAQDAATYAHIEQCAGCRSDYQAEVSLGEMLREHAAREERELPSLVKAEIWRRVRADKPQTSNRFTAWMRPAVAIPVAAALALAAYFGSIYVAPHGAPSIEASYYLQDHAAMNTTIPFNDHTSANPAALEAAALADIRRVAVDVQPAAYTANAAP